MAVLRAWSFPVGSSGKSSASVIFRPTSSAEQLPVDSEYLPALVTCGTPGLQSCIVTHPGPWALEATEIDKRPDEEFRPGCRTRE